MPIKISQFFKPTTSKTTMADNQTFGHFDIKQEKVTLIENINFDDVSTNCFSKVSKSTTNDFINNVKIELEQEFSIIRTTQNLKSFVKVEQFTNFNQNSSISSFSVIKSESVKSGVQCNFCAKVLSQKRKLNEHILRMHPDKLNNLHECKICNSKFVKLFKLELHMRNKHTNEKVQQFECDFDGKIFNNKNSMYLHMRTHQASIRCKICQADVKPRTFLNHMKNSHKNIDIKCEVCQKSFRSQNLLKAHQKIHNKRFECKICNRMFPELNRLKKHEKEAHKNLKTFKCEDCDKKFPSKSRLKLHQKVHNKTRPKPYKCQRCNYSTDVPQNFKHHQTFHENQEKKFAAMKNPIKCDKCAVLCRNKDALWMHNRRVHSNISYQCDLCGQYGKIKANMERHLMIVHMKK
ncbi:hypothetical protein ACKWTF_012582 [Chironomus riparius]